MKQWYESKTVWIAILQFAIGVITLIIGVLQGSTQFDVPGILLILKSVADLWVRLQTDTAIQSPLTRENL